MRYALTGATGFLGGEIARQLRSDGHDVVVLVRDPEKAGSLADMGVRLVSGDLADAGALDELCAGVDGLFHLAAWNKLGERNGAAIAEKANVTGTRDVLEAAKRNGVPKVVYTSTIGVNSDTRGEVVDEDHRHDGPYLSAYERTKAEAHRIALEYAADGLDVRIVQPGVVYGPGDTSFAGELIAQTVRGKRLQVPSRGEVCWSYVSDVAQGHILAMERGRPGRSYFLTGPRATWAEGIAVAARLAGTREPGIVPAAMVAAMTRLMTVVAKVVPLPPEHHPELARSALATYLGSSARAEEELGWSARSLEAGMRETVAALKG